MIYMQKKLTLLENLVYVGSQTQTHLVRLECNFAATSGTRPHATVMAFVADTIGKLCLVANLADGPLAGDILSGRSLLLPLLGQLLNGLLVIGVVILKIPANKKG